MYQAAQIIFKYSHLKRCLEKIKKLAKNHSQLALIRIPCLWETR